MNGSTVATRDHLRALVSASLEPLPAGPGPGAVGVESEHLLIHVSRDGAPRGRATLQDLTGLLDDHPELEPEPPHPLEVRGWRRRDGARLLPEPGAQLEYAGPPMASGVLALVGLEAALSDVAALMAPRGTALVSAGLDLWHPTGAVAQQLTCPRYPAMHGYLASRSPHGHVMMTSTASLQVNLDLGGPGTAARRWRLAMLASPLVTATFACSPVPGAVSGRAAVWQWLDPTRTSVPRALVAGAEDPVEILLDSALTADVLLFRRGNGAVPGERGFTMARWLDEPHPEHGSPTPADLAYHLTTLFPPVRTRGYLEVRGVDSLPSRWRAVPVVLLAGLLYDERALDTMLDVLQPHTSRLPELMARAAHLGVADGELCAMSVEVWSAAAEGAARLGPEYLPTADVRRADRFLEHFTMRGRAPSDELRERLAEGPRAALDWAREPVGSLHTC